MKTILLSLLVSLVTICAWLPMFILGVGLEMNQPGSADTFIKVAVWISVLLIGQPLFAIPYVIISALIGGIYRLYRRTA